MNKKNKKGAALVLVLLLLAIMTILVAEFLFNLRVQASLFNNHEAKLKARFVARAGQNAAGALISRTNIENETLFNNEATGVQLYRYTCITPAGMGGLSAILGGSDEMPSQEQLQALRTQNEEQLAEDFEGIHENQNCGLWSLAIPYELGSYPLDLDISDEQARLNLNALIKPVKAPQDEDSGQTGEVEFQYDMPMFYALYELFIYQMVRNDIELQVDPMILLEDIRDYIDYGVVEGSFDVDRINYIEYEDRIISMKNGPLDTVDEIRMIPGMTDEFFDAIKDFVTVYPTTPDPQLGTSFSKEVNMNAASMEVIYALIRASSYSTFVYGGAGEAKIEIEKALELATEMIQANYPKYQRTIPGTLMTNPEFKAFQMTPNAANATRFFRVKSTALTDDGLETTITRVVRVNQNKTLSSLYYRED